MIKEFIKAGEQILRPNDLEKLNENQLRQLQSYHMLHWEYFLDNHLIYKNAEFVTLVNYQKYDYNEKFDKQITHMRQERKKNP